MLGFAAAAVLVWDRLGAEQRLDTAPLGFAFAFACALVWSSYSVASRLLASVPSESLAAPCLVTAVLAAVASYMFEQWVSPPNLLSWAALAGLGLGPLGAAFLLWDVGMKYGNVPLLGVLSYAGLLLSTGLLIALGLAEPTWALAIACALMVTAAVVATRKA